METFLVSFPHIAEEIFGYLDMETLKKCWKVSESWANFLENQMFFLTKLTNGHPEWDKIYEKMHFAVIYRFSKSFLAIEADSEIFGKIHPIFCGIHLNDKEIFKAMITLYPDFHKLKIRTKFRGFYLNNSPFHFAAKTGKLQMVEYFIENAALENQNPKDKIGITPLHLASLHGHEKVVKLLLENIKGEKNPQDLIACTPLHLASISGHLKIVKMILDNIEGEKNPKDFDGLTPLHFASKSGQFEIVKLLLNKIEGEKNPKDENGKTPLDFAVESGNLEIVELLLNNNEEAENQKLTLKSDHVEISKLGNKKCLKLGSSSF